MEAAALSDDVAAKVCRQVEFYFSDSNLPNDRFLLRSVEESEDGLVSIGVVCAFSRMRGHLQLKEATPETVPKEVIAVVANVLRKSPSLKVSEDGLKVGRASPLLKPEEARADVNTRSLAVSPLPWKTTREEVEEFFGGFSKVYSVRLPRHPASKVFSGYAVVEFPTVEEAQKVSQMTLAFKGADLKFQSKESFEKYMNSLGSQNQKEREDSYPKGLIVSIKLEKITKKTDDAEKKDAEMKEAQEVKGEEDQAKEKPDESETTATTKEDGEHKEKKAEEKTEKKNGIHTDEIVREDLKAALQQYGTVKFIDFSRGDTSGYIRFETSEDADKARTAAVLSEDGGIVIKSFLATLEALQGDAERDYWKKVRESQSKRKESGGNQNKHGKDNRGRFGKHKKQWKNQPAPATSKHTRLDDDENEDEPESKAQKTE